MRDEQCSMNPDYAHQLKWYYWPRLPLLPDWHYRPGDNQNTWSFHIHWLVFRAWTSDAPQLGVSVNLDDTQLCLRLNLPYLWTGIFIPVFPINVRHRFWRKAPWLRT